MLRTCFYFVAEIVTVHSIGEIFDISWNNIESLSLEANIFVVTHQKDCFEIEIL